MVFVAIRQRPLLRHQLVAATLAVETCNHPPLYTVQDQRLIRLILPLLMTSQTTRMSCFVVSKTIAEQKAFLHPCIH